MTATLPMAPRLIERLMRLTWACQSCGVGRKPLRSRLWQWCPNPECVGTCAGIRLMAPMTMGRRVVGRRVWARRLERYNGAEVWLWRVVRHA